MFHSAKRSRGIFHFKYSFYSVFQQKPHSLLEPIFVTGAKIRKTYDVSSSTLRSWAEQGKIKVVRSQEGKGKRLYNLRLF